MRALKNVLLGEIVRKVLGKSEEERALHLFLKRASVI